jgi:hypothetical protein
MINLLIIETESSLFGGKKVTVLMLKLISTKNTLVEMFLLKAGLLKDTKRIILGSFLFGEKRESDDNHRF